MEQPKILKWFDNVWKRAAKKSCRYGKYRSFEPLLFFFYLTAPWSAFLAFELHFGLLHSLSSFHLCQVEQVPPALSKSVVLSSKNDFMASFFAQSVFNRLDYDRVVRPRSYASTLSITLVQKGQMTLFNTFCIGWRDYVIARIVKSLHINKGIVNV